MAEALQRLAEALVSNEDPTGDVRLRASPTDRLTADRKVAARRKLVESLGLEPETQFPLDPAYAQPNRPIQTLGRAFSSGLETGIQKMHSAFAGTEALVQDALGGDPSDALLTMRYHDAAAARASVGVETFEDFLSSPTIGGLFRIGAQSAGEYPVDIGLGVAGAAAGAIAGGPIGAVKGMVGGTALKTGANTLAKRYIREVAGKKARGMNLSNAEKELLRQSYVKATANQARRNPSLAKQFLDDATGSKKLTNLLRRAGLRRRRLVGAAAGSFLLSNWPQGGGEAARELYDPENTGTEGDPTRRQALGGLAMGAAVGAVDLVADVSILSSLSKIARERGGADGSFAGRIFRDAGKATALAASKEGVTEAIQELGMLGYRELLDPGHWDREGTDPGMRIGEAAFRAALGASPYGAVGGAATSVAGSAAPSNIAGMAKDMYERTVNTGKDVYEKSMDTRAGQELQRVAGVVSDEAKDIAERAKNTQTGIGFSVAGETIADIAKDITKDRVEKTIRGRREKRRKIDPAEVEEARRELDEFREQMDDDFDTELEIGEDIESNKAREAHLDRQIEETRREIEELRQRKAISDAESEQQEEEIGDAELVHRAFGRSPFDPDRFNLWEDLEWALDDEVVDEIRKTASDPSAPPTTLREIHDRVGYRYHPDEDEVDAAKLLDRPVDWNRLASESVGQGSRDIVLPGIDDIDPAAIAQYEETRTDAVLAARQARLNPNDAKAQTTAQELAVAAERERPRDAYSRLEDGIREYSSEEEALEKARKLDGSADAIGIMIDQKKRPKYEPVQRNGRWTVARRLDESVAIPDEEQEARPDSVQEPQSESKIDYRRMRKRIDELEDKAVERRIAEWRNLDRLGHESPWSDVPEEMQEPEAWVAENEATPDESQGYRREYARREVEREEKFNELEKVAYRQVESQLRQQPEYRRYVSEMNRLKRLNKASDRFKRTLANPQAGPNHLARALVRAADANSPDYAKERDKRLRNRVGVLKRSRRPQTIEAIQKEIAELQNDKDFDEAMSTRGGLGRVIEDPELVRVGLRRLLAETNPSDETIDEFADIIRQGQRPETVESREREKRRLERSRRVDQGFASARRREAMGIDEETETQEEELKSAVLEAEETNIGESAVEREAEEEFAKAMEDADIEEDTPAAALSLYEVDEGKRETFYEAGLVQETAKDGYAVSENFQGPDSFDPLLRSEWMKFKRGLTFAERRAWNEVEPKMSAALAKKMVSSEIADRKGLYTYWPKVTNTDRERIQVYRQQITGTGDSEVRLLQRIDWMQTLLKRNTQGLGLVDPKQREVVFVSGDLEPRALRQGGFNTLMSLGRSINTMDNYAPMGKGLNRAQQAKLGIMRAMSELHRERSRLIYANKEDAKFAAKVFREGGTPEEIAKAESFLWNPRLDTQRSWPVPKGSRPDDARNQFFVRYKEGDRYTLNRLFGKDWKGDEQTPLPKPAVDQAGQLPDIDALEQEVHGLVAAGLKDVTHKDASESIAELIGWKEPILRIVMEETDFQDQNGKWTQKKSPVVKGLLPGYLEAIVQEDKGGELSRRIMEDKKIAADRAAILIEFLDRVRHYWQNSKEETANSRIVTSTGPYHIADAIGWESPILKITRSANMEDAVFFQSGFLDAVFAFEVPDGSEDNDFVPLSQKIREQQAKIDKNKKGKKKDGLSHGKAHADERLRFLAAVVDWKTDTQGRAETENVQKRWFEEWLESDSMLPVREDLDFEDMEPGWEFEFQLQTLVQGSDHLNSLKKYYQSAKRRYERIRNANDNIRQLNGYRLLALRERMRGEKNPRILEVLKLQEVDLAEQAEKAPIRIREEDAALDNMLRAEANIPIMSRMEAEGAHYLRKDGFQEVFPRWEADAPEVVLNPYPIPPVSAEATMRRLEEKRDDLDQEQVANVENWLRENGFDVEEETKEPSAQTVEEEMERPSAKAIAEAEFAKLDEDERNEILADIGTKAPSVQKAPIAQRREQRQKVTPKEATPIAKRRQEHIDWIPQIIDRSSNGLSQEASEVVRRFGRISEDMNIKITVAKPDFARTVANSLRKRTDKDSIKTGVEMQAAVERILDSSSSVRGSTILHKNGAMVIVKPIENQGSRQERTIQALIMGHELGHVLFKSDLDRMVVRGGKLTPIGKNLMTAWREQEPESDPRDTRAFEEWYADQTAVFMLSDEEARKAGIRRESLDPKKHSAAIEFFKKLAQRMKDWLNKLVDALEKKQPLQARRFRQNQAYRDYAVDLVNTMGSGKRRPISFVAANPVRTHMAMELDNRSDEAREGLAQLKVESRDMILHERELLRKFDPKNEERKIPKDGHGTIGTAGEIGSESKEILSRFKTTFQSVVGDIIVADTKNAVGTSRMLLPNDPKWINFIKQTADEIDDDKNSLQAAVSDSVMGNSVSGNFSLIVLKPVGANKIDRIQQAIKLGHELGHVLYLRSISSLEKSQGELTEEGMRLHEAYFKDTTAEQDFEEWYADRTSMYLLEDLKLTDETTKKRLEEVKQKYKSSLALRFAARYFKRLAARLRKWLLIAFKDMFAKNPREGARYIPEKQRLALDEAIRESSKDAVRLKGDEHSVLIDRNTLTREDIFRDYIESLVRRMKENKSLVKPGLSDNAKTNIRMNTEARDMNLPIQSAMESNLAQGVRNAFSPRWVQNKITELTRRGSLDTLASIFVPANTQLRTISPPLADFFDKFHNEVFRMRNVRRTEIAQTMGIKEPDKMASWDEKWVRDAWRIAADDGFSIEHLEAEGRHANAEKKSWDAARGIRKYLKDYYNTHFAAEAEEAELTEEEKQAIMKQVRAEPDPVPDFQDAEAQEAYQDLVDESREEDSVDEIFGAGLAEQLPDQETEEQALDAEDAFASGLAQQLPDQETQDQTFNAENAFGAALSQQLPDEESAFGEGLAAQLENVQTEERQTPQPEKDKEVIYQRKEYFPRQLDMKLLRASSIQQQRLISVIVDYWLKNKKDASAFVFYTGNDEKGFEMAAKEAARAFVDSLLKDPEDSEEFGIKKDEGYTPVIQSSKKRILGKIPSRNFSDRGLLEDPENSLMAYFHQAEKMIAYKKFGTIVNSKGEKKNIIKEELKKVPRQRLAAAERNVGAQMEMSGEIITPGWRTFNDWAWAATVWTTLGLSFFGSLPETAASYVRGYGKLGMGDWMRQMRDTHSSDENKKLADAIGVVAPEALETMFMGIGSTPVMGKTMRSGLDAFFRATGLSWITRFNRHLSAGMGREFLLQAAITNDRLDRRYLEELGTSAADVRLWSKIGRPLSAEQINRELDGKEFTLFQKDGPKKYSTAEQRQATRRVVDAIFNFVSQSVARPVRGTQPVAASGQKAQFVYHLTSFLYDFGYRFVMPMLRETSRLRQSGDTREAAHIMLMAFGTMLPLAAVGLELREATRFALRFGFNALPGVDSDPWASFRSDDMGGFEYAFELLDRSGLLGPFALANAAFGAMSMGNNPVVSSIPIVDMAVQASEGNMERLVPLASNVL